MSAVATGWRVEPAAPLIGQLAVPADASLALRAVLLATLADGEVRILGADPEAPLVASAIAAAKALGCRVAEEPDGVVVAGRGGRFGVPGAALETLGDPATIALLGALAARQPEGTYTLAGDRRTETDAIVAVLRAQGAEILVGADGLPIRIVAGSRPLVHADHVLPGGSDVLKLIGLVAGLGTEDGATVVEVAASPDSAERMIRSLGGRLERRGPRITHVSRSTLHGGTIEVPGDPDVAAAFVLAATLVPGSTLYLTGVGANPGRGAMLALLERMGARIGTSGRRLTAAGEPIVDLEVRSSELVGADIDEGLALALGPQLPLALIAVACARGRSRLRAPAQVDDDAVDRAARHLFAIGAHPRITPGGLDVQGVPARVRGGAVGGVAGAGGTLAFAVAGLYSESGIAIDDVSSLDRHYPAFRSLLAALVAPRSPS